MIRRLLSAWHWRRMQRHYARLEQSSATQIKGRARKERMALVHAALGAKR